MLLFCVSELMIQFHLFFTHMESFQVLLGCKHPHASRYFTDVYTHFEVEVFTELKLFNACKGVQ